MKNTVLDFIPNKQIGDVRFGMKKQDVRNILGKKYRSFRKSIFSKSTTDAYSDYHVYYTQDGTLEAVEIFGSVEVWFKGEKLFPGTVAEALRILPDLEPDDGGYISRKLSVGLYAPDNDRIESILVGRESYYG